MNTETLEGEKPSEVVPRLIADMLSIELADVKPESLIVKDLGADSLDVVEILMAVEDEFSIEISDAEERAVSTVADAIELVNRKLDAVETPANLRSPE